MSTIREDLNACAPDPVDSNFVEFTNASLAPFTHIINVLLKR